jgi:mono/diheme cytochrome c family protein
VNATIPALRAQRTWPTRLPLFCLLSAFYPLLLGCGPVKTTATPLNQLNAQQMQGHDIFQTRCAQCHDDRDRDALHGPSLLSVYKQTYLPSGAPANDERVSETILEGHGMMPPIRTMDSQELTDLLAYLHTL